MEILEQTRIRLHQRLLRKGLPAHQVKRSSVFLENAKSIGVLFDATALEERNIVLQFAEKMKHQSKKVKLLGYFDEKLKSSDFPFLYFDKKQLDWAFRPKSEEVNAFSKEPFDLLVNISKKTILPLDYIAAYSKARFRVGPFTENTFCYDLMIDIDEKKGLTAFLNQVLHYLGKMQPEKKSAVV
ncbi:MAG: hypothetical protein AAFZ15_01170 [Bacteroidota bacterium]